MAIGGTKGATGVVVPAKVKQVETPAVTPAPAPTVKPPESKFTDGQQPVVGTGEKADANATAQLQNKRVGGLGFEATGPMTLSDVRGSLKRMDEQTFADVFHEFQFAMRVEYEAAAMANARGMIADSDYDKG